MVSTTMSPFGSLQPPRELHLVIEDDDDCISSLSVCDVTPNSSFNSSDAIDRIISNEGTGSSRDIPVRAVEARKTITSSLDTKQKKKPVRFDLINTVYSHDHVYDETGQSNQEAMTDERSDCKTMLASDTWYSQEDLRRFKAETWMTISWLLMGKNTDIEQRMKNVMNNRSKDKKHHEFCARGVESKMPIGLIITRKRRHESMNAVFFYQQVQQQQQKILLETSSSSSSTFTLSKQRLQIDQDYIATAIAKTYASYCEEAREAALAVGRQDEEEVTAASTKEQARKCQTPRAVAITVSTDMDGVGDENIEINLLPPCVKEDDLSKISLCTSSINDGTSTTVASTVFSAVSNDHSAHALTTTRKNAAQQEVKETVIFHGDGDCSRSSNSIRELNFRDRSSSRRRRKIYSSSAVWMSPSFTASCQSFLEAAVCLSTFSLQ